MARIQRVPSPQVTTTWGWQSRSMLKTFIVYYQYQQPGDKKPGPIRHFRLHATNVEEARQLAIRQANYENIEVLRVKQI